MSHQITKPRLIAYFCEWESEVLSHSRIGASLIAKELGYDLVFIRDWEMLDTSRIDGLLYSVRGREDREMLKKLSADGLPIVCVDVSIEGLDSIVFDNNFGIGCAVSHLHELGHRRIVYAGGPVDNQNADERLEGFKNGITAVGIEEKDTTIIEGGFDYFTARASMLELLSPNFDYTAVVCGNDHSASGVISAILQTGRRVPEDIAVTGYDNSHLYDFATGSHLTTYVPLSTYSSTAFRNGRIAMQVLHEKVSGSVEEPEIREIRGIFFSRQSTIGRKSMEVPCYEDPDIARIFNRVMAIGSHMPREALDEWALSLSGIGAENWIEYSAIRDALLKTIDDGFDIYIGYPLLLHIRSAISGGLSVKSKRINRKILFGLINEFLDEREGNSQFYHYSLNTRLEDCLKPLRVLDSEPSAMRIADSFHLTFQSMGVRHASILLLDEPSDESEPFVGKGVIWQLSEGSDVQYHAIEFEPNQFYLQDIAPEHILPLAYDSFFLKASGKVLGVMLLDVECDYWSMFSKLSDIASRLMYNFGLFENLRLKSEELERQKTIAEVANRAKTEFLTVMSHELRTPLNCVIGMTEIVILTEELRDESKRFLELAKGAGMDLLTIINDILDFTKIESDRVELKQFSFDLKGVMQTCIDLFSENAGEKGLYLNLEMSDAISRDLSGDAGRLKQIILRLIANGLKFTEKGGVTLRVEEESRSDSETSILFCVRDTGVGIPSDKVQSVFKIFEQVDSSDSRAYGGSGLGLAIASRLAVKMGGRMWLESVEGQGSSFYFTVKLRTGAGQSGPLEYLSESVKDGRGSVLLIEEMKRDASLLIGLLKNEGYQVIHIEDGEHAVDMLQKRPFDIVLLDIQMSKFDAWKTATDIRESEKVSEKERRLAILALTSHAASGFEERCIESGMDGFLLKPFERERVLAVVKRLIASSSRA